MDYESTFEGYMMFRMTEAEHMERTYSQPHWTEQSANPGYEKFVYQEYMGAFPR